VTAHPILVEAWRGPIVESMHRGALAVVDADGGLRLALGDIDRPIFPRSAVKLLQALPLVESGAAEQFGLGDAELALACASHIGEPVHVQTAAAMLARTGLDATVLECGSHWPYSEAAQRAMAVRDEAPGPLHNNCSGKHAGFVCLGCAMADAAGSDRRAFLTGYGKPGHPVMREVGAALQATTGWDLSKTVVATDGCSIPTCAIPLRHLALAFARVASGQGLRPGHAAAARRLRRAIAAAPQMVAGTGKLDTLLAQRLGERLLCKVGAEGVYCAALPELGLGLAVKMDDGNNARACEVVMATLAGSMLTLSADEAAFVQGFGDAPITNRNGLRVGRLAASDGLRAALVRS